MSERERVELRVSPEWLAAVDKARGEVPRGTWVKARALEAALSHYPSGVTVPLKKGPHPEGKTFSEQIAETGDELQAREERRASAPAKPASEPAETPLPSIAKRRVR